MERHAEGNTFAPRLQYHPTEVRTDLEVSNRCTNLLRIETALTLLLLDKRTACLKSELATQSMEVPLLGRESQI